MSTVQSEQLDQGRILLVKLDRAKANILNAEMIGDLRAEIETKTGPETVAIVVSHNGPHFSFGASVEEHQKAQAAAMLEAFHGLFHYLHQLSIPLLAAVRGQCLGGGLELAGFCHFIFADKSAVFAQPEIKLAVFPPMASLIFGIKAPQIADEINCTGRSFSAEEFKVHGIVQSITEDPEQAALSFARQHFLGLSSSSVRHSIRASRWRWTDALKRVLPDLETLYLDELMSTTDANEGIGSFLEKRKPQWRHC